MDRRRYLATVATTTALGLAGCGGSTSDDTGSDPTATPTPAGSELRGPTEEDVEQVDLQFREWTESEIETVRNEAQSVGYEDLARNAESYTGDYVTGTATVVQTLEGPDADYSVLVLSYDGRGGDVVLGSWLGGRYLQGDIVTYWGEVLGTETYGTVNAGQLTVPAIAIADAELQNTDTA